MDNLNYYAHERIDILKHIPESVTSLLDVGCGIGSLGKKFKEQHNCCVTGIEIVPEVADIAKQNIDKIFCYDLENYQAPFKDSEFDCIVFADILEHLKEPEKIFGEYLRFLKKGGNTIVSIPNVRNLDVISDLINGKWEYKDSGILDRTHLRFFTNLEFMKIISRLNLEILNIDYLDYDNFKNLRLYNGVLNFGRLSIKNVTINELNEMKALQIVYNLKKI